EAARRELDEELGCGHDSIVEVAAYDGFSERQREERRVYVHYCDGPFRPSPDEVDAISFHTVDEIHRLLTDEQFTGGFRRSLSILLDSPLSPERAGPPPTG